MTGNDIHQIRTDSGLSACELAELVGVGCSSIYRWEDAEKKEPKIEGRPKALFSIFMLLKPPQIQEVAEAHREGGWVLALHRLTGFAYKKANGRGRKK